MLNPIAAFFEKIFRGLGRGIGLFISWLIWPFAALYAWVVSKSFVIKAVAGFIVLLFVGLYGYFIWQTQWWAGFSPDYVNSYNLEARKRAAGLPLNVAVNAVTEPGAPVEAPPAATCERSAIVDVAADLIDLNVNQNAWVSSMLLYKLGLFGMDWDDTPWMDNKASFQRGVNQAIRRTSVELVDSLGRVRGTSGINADLQSARGNMQFDESTWYFGFQPFGPKSPSPSYYRAAMNNLRAFNTSLVKCEAIFDGRSDNLVEFIDRIANDLGNTSAIIRERSENYNGGWFDARADDRFWFAYGQLYGYYGVLAASAADFEGVVTQRGLKPLFDETLKQLQASLRIQPTIISNGREDGWIMPTHLSTMGFYILRVRSNLVEMRDVLAR
ncbi:DUF2333 family protein [Rhizobium sp. CFBP 8762]|uniref:DUF2333 family protein n=1 Tax=Rhizobium sp. CFBP 8762 TaxID=2775279 RepID=UPI0017809EEF|nr:DUF2333 family protein [Rhizobium sp. CFBP 8762]MBD8556513.1 DUF2333 family protein [Rhizobium sp. CFBP 8762]